MTPSFAPRLAPRIDGLQYANWSEKIFRQLRKSAVFQIAMIYLWPMS